MQTRAPLIKYHKFWRCPKASLCIIAFYHAISMLSKQCLDSGFWASPEFMILNQRCPGTLSRLYWCVQRYCGISQQEAVGRKTSLAENGYSLLNRLNAADDRLLLRPKGAAPISRICVTGLEKGALFPAVCALTWLIRAALNRQTT